tara:strand:+ start:331 stop:579 length:249 start_codon:yes stop_codon:yes gene_type:complete
MTTLTIILITWFLSGLLSNILVIIDQKENILIKDIKLVFLLILMGYIGLFIVLLVLILEKIKLPKIKLPSGDTVIWKYPKKK